jgi:hypothetical protein
MNLSRLSPIILAISVTAFAPVGVASAQTTLTPPTGSVTCAIAQGALTAAQEQVVNSYEILVAKANSKHTAIPTMPGDVYALIGCTSPASETSGVSVAATSTVPPPLSATPTQSSSTFICPPNGLSKAQSSLINSYEVLVAKANSKHTVVPSIPPEVAALINCQ